MKPHVSALVSIIVIMGFVLFRESPPAAPVDADTPSRDRPKGPKPPSCYDFLQGYPELRRMVHFEECKYVGGQLGTYEATYTVAGASAPVVNDWLMKESGAPDVKFVCCGWEPIGGGAGSLKGPHEFDFQIRMFSGETLIDDRNRWKEIDSFKVLVELWTTRP